MGLGRVARVDEHMAPSRRPALFLAETYEGRLPGNFLRSEKTGASPSDPADFYRPPPRGRVRRVISSGAKRASGDRQPSPADNRAKIGVATAESPAFSGLHSSRTQSCVFKATSVRLRYYAARRMT